MKNKKVYFAKMVLVCGTLALAACGMVKKDENASVIQRKAVQRWDYLIAHQADKAYDFLSPGYRATTTREAYATGMNNRPVTWKSVQFVDQSCTEDACTVHVKLKYDVAVNMHGVRTIQGDSPLTEHWIKDSGRWYFLPGRPRSAAKAVE